ncbi:hypothetical protein IFM89_002584 [Coptis chinensis]|uniref:Uncharacterized protein n=1 Tax=Coptis chinensis TaxID=261450 RepID=A0A835HAZ1_9MAGN|nr:hypothetical protein IFM89_002584 [Coptis chinensis]
MNPGIFFSIALFAFSFPFELWIVPKAHSSHFHELNNDEELKGNIRDFCRVQPMLPDDGASAEASVICYPTSTESLGRGIDLLQNGNLGIDKSGLTAF